MRSLTLGEQLHHTIVQQRQIGLSTPTKKTGFFAESAGCNEYFCKKPGFWAPSKSYLERT
ncbi:MAG: hypothetical protein EAZ60_29320 [Oscillatoriales cyanobacterium]|nr:MAG: hypothetical protein EAZ83_31100 [Oscillatoriales cyanobacterium]TAE91902.1 MAG: hypothetical protein EAZ79_30780 [Oscillatoriales cyanobacterium]TAF12994.1 MAG: hypothetical protein EAZ73_30940 [Oscillatoriales cyanobacterium]TAF32253.1 MAG: hypothetical protein EAZ69_18210 [Oscillatoriales cyanobacterium]TAF50284.1 MAG: hypothetical protein EAZ60_29320 [Oscillatoriales cyanobacterium]